MSLWTPREPKPIYHNHPEPRSSFACITRSQPLHPSEVPKGHKALYTWPRDYRIAVEGLGLTTAWDENNWVTIPDIMNGITQNKDRFEITEVTNYYNPYTLWSSLAHVASAGCIKWRDIHDRELNRKKKPEIITDVEFAVIGTSEKQAKAIAVAPLHEQVRGLIDRIAPGIGGAGIVGAIS